MDKRKKRTFSFGSRSFVLTAAIIVILGGVISGTVAWMFIKSDPVHNTFTYGDMKVELTETDTNLDDDDKDETNSYSLKPDARIAKDPIVTVKAGTVDSWVFVQIDKSDNFDEYMTYSMAEGWKALDKEKYPGIYYRQVAKSSEDQKIQVLEGNCITVKTDTTQEALDKLAEDIEAEEAECPTLTFTAYAVQLSELDKVEDAWKAAKGR